MVTQSKPAVKTPAAKTPAPKPSSAVATQEGGVLAESARPSFLKDTARGAENVGVADLVIPRLEVVQSLSPCRKKGDPDYIEGAEEGMLYNNVTRELYGEEVTVVPCYFLKEWLIWKDRKKGGGFRGAFPSKAEADKAISELKDSEGKKEPAEDFTALDTAQHFCLLLPPSGGKPQQIVISMAKSKMKVSRKWNSLMNLAGDDTFARAYKIMGVGDKNAKNEDFYNLAVKALGYVTEPIYIAAEKMHEAIKKGGVRADTSGFDADDNHAEGSTESKEF